MPRPALPLALLALALPALTDEELLVARSISRSYVGNHAHVIALDGPRDPELDSSAALELEAPSCVRVRAPGAYLVGAVATWGPGGPSQRSLELRRAFGPELRSWRVLAFSLKRPSSAALFVQRVEPELHELELGDCVVVVALHSEGSPVEGWRELALSVELTIARP